MKGKKLTNADYIRKMTDEELSMQIATLVVLAFDQVVPDWTWKVDREMRITGTAKDLLEWLKEPYKEKS